MDDIIPKNLINTELENMEISRAKRGKNIQEKNQIFFDEYQIELSSKYGKFLKENTKKFNYPKIDNKGDFSYYWEKIIGNGEFHLFNKKFSINLSYKIDFINKFYRFETKYNEFNGFTEGTVKKVLSLEELKPKDSYQKKLKVKYFKSFDEIIEAVKEYIKNIYQGNKEGALREIFIFCENLLRNNKLEEYGSYKYPRLISTFIEMLRNKDFFLKYKKGEMNTNEENLIYQIEYEKERYIGITEEGFLYMKEILFKIIEKMKNF